MPFFSSTPPPPPPPSWDIDAALQQDFAKACAIVIAVSLTTHMIARFLPLHDVKTLQQRKTITLEHRVEAGERLLLTPFWTVIAYLAINATLELKGSLDLRWHGATYTSRWCSLLYCAKMAVDVPLSAYELRAKRSAQLMMVAHHLLSFVAIGCGLATKRCAFFACMALCAEASTPFLNNITAAKLFGGQQGADSLIHFLSGIMLWIAYVPFRMVNFPVWLWVWYSDIQSDPAETSQKCTYFELIFHPAVILMLLYLSSVWFVAITKGCVKGIRKATQAPSRVAKED